MFLVYTDIHLHLNSHLKTEEEEQQPHGNTPNHNNSGVLDNDCLKTTKQLINRCKHILNIFEIDFNLSQCDEDGGDIEVNDDRNCRSDHGQNNNPEHYIDMNLNHQKGIIILIIFCYFLKLNSN